MYNLDPKKQIEAISEKPQMSKRTKTPERQFLTLFLENPAKGYANSGFWKREKP
jgi:hypothetical protein